MGRENLLNLIETLDQSDASVQRIFGGEGSAVGAAVRRRTANPLSKRQYEKKLYEAMKFVADVYDGRRPQYQLREALGTADFPLLFGDIIDRQLLANYRETPQTFRNYCKVATVPDFRQVKRFAINYAEGRLPQVPQQSEYPERKDVPARLGRGARRTEEFFATSLFVDANGPIAGFYNTANKNRVHTENGASVNNPPLSIQGLQDAMLVLMSMVDFDGEPIVIDAVHLVVPPGQEIIANNILNATELWINLATATTTPPQQQLHTQNWMRNKVRLSTNYYIPRIASSANGSTSWFLFADPGTSRPAIEVGFLRGHEEPEIFAKDPNAMRIGGGATAVLDGDFDTDSIQYKIRHVLGGTLMDPRATVASNGSGS